MSQTQSIKTNFYVRTPIDNAVQTVIDCRFPDMKLPRMLTHTNFCVRMPTVCVAYWERIEAQSIKIKFYVRTPIDYYLL